METIEKIYQYAHKRNNEGIIIDTNVLLLFFIGRYNQDYIKEFKHTNTYSKEDYSLVEHIIKPFNKIIITPQIIAEISNHSLQGLNNERLHNYISLIVNLLLDASKTEEHNFSFKEWENKDISILSKFGFIDMNMYEIAKKRAVPILTDDKKFYEFAKGKGEIPIIKLSVVKYSDVFKF